MSAADMNHLEYIDQIAQRDCDELRTKEATYQGSWKQRGGIGAFMMMARKWDRIEPMCKKRHYDVFENVGDGSDGSLIAEIRDLRRYLLLVESELASKGKIPGVARVRSVVAPPVDSETAAKLKEEWEGKNEFFNYEKNEFFNYELPKPSPESGSQHAALGPWIVNSKAASLYPDFYHKVGHDRYVLEPWVPDGTVPFSLSNLYLVTAQGFVVRMEDCPVGAREYFPTLQEEVNHFELKKLPSWQQFLYEWHEKEDKYRVRNRSWLDASESVTA